MSVYIIRTERHLELVEATQTFHDAVTAESDAEAEDVAWDALVSEAEFAAGAEDDEEGLGEDDRQKASLNRDRLEVSFEGEYDFETHRVVKITKITSPDDVLRAMSSTP